LEAERTEVAVKNTFIHFDDEDKHQNSVATRSMPLQGLRKHAPSPTSDCSPNFARDCGTFSASSSMCTSSSSPKAQIGDDNDKLASQPLAFRQSSLVQKLPATEEMREVKTTQLLPSVGSLSHGNGTCRPCGFFWKPEGCANGQDCRHCHACPPAESRRRKKERTKESKMAYLKQKLCEFQDAAQSIC
jgi:hypothetical protein